MLAINRKAMRRGAQLGVLCGLVVASVMTSLDYRRNPSGIFHGEAGVQWNHVLETWVSWFMPVTLLSTVLLILGLVMLGRLSRRPTGEGGASE